MPVAGVSAFAPHVTVEPSHILTSVTSMARVVPPPSTARSMGLACMNMMPTECSEIAPQA